MPTPDLQGSCPEGYRVRSRFWLLKTQRSCSTHLNEDSLHGTWKDSQTAKKYSQLFGTLSQRSNVLPKSPHESWLRWMKCENAWKSVIQQQAGSSASTSTKGNHANFWDPPPKMHAQRVCTSTTREFKRQLSLPSSGERGEMTKKSA
jgi:hypothetical protein